MQCLIEGYTTPCRNLGKVDGAESRVNRVRLLQLFFLCRRAIVERPLLAVIVGRACGCLRMCRFLSRVKVVKGRLDVLVHRALPGLAKCWFRLGSYCFGHRV